MRWGFEDTGLLLAPLAAYLTPCTPAADDPRLEWFRENLHLFPQEFRPAIPEGRIGRGDWVLCAGSRHLVVAESDDDVALTFLTIAGAFSHSRKGLTRTDERPDDWADIEARWGIER